MQIERFKENIIPLMTSSDNDETFAAIRVMTHGMSAPREAKLLNFAARCLEPKEFYIEIGTFTGFTLISAAYENNAYCIGIDDFSMKDICSKESLGISKGYYYDKLNKNLQTFNQHNVQFIENDFRNVKLMEEAKGNLGVLFIDGNHDYKNVMDAFDWALPYLTEKSVLIFDDVIIDGVAQAVRELWTKHDMELLFYTKSTLAENDVKFHMNKPLDKAVANGFAVMIYDKTKGNINA